MRTLLQFLIRNGNFLIFLILEVVAFILIGTTQQYQKVALLSSANGIAAGIQSVNSAVVSYFTLRQDNMRLEAENAELKNQLMVQANRLEALTERDSQYVYTHLEWGYIPAKVIGSTWNKQYNYLTINKGKCDGIMADMGVVCHDGVVGIVSAAGEHYALVVPLIHARMMLSCRLKKNDYVGATEWNGRDYRQVGLTHIARHIPVSVGDTVVTSGLTPMFPEGILVGAVADTELDDSDNFHRIKVALATDYKELKYVQVLHNRALQVETDIRP